MRTAIKLSLVLVSICLIGYFGSRPLSSFEIVNKRHISGIVVPHHDLVRVERSQFFYTIAREIQPPKTVILVSPNHFGVGTADIQTTDKVWQLSNGTLQPDRSALVGDIETESFLDEHGIYNILPDIHHAWPDAKIVPIMLKMNADITGLAELLKEKCNECLLVASVDFSHYQPAVLANLHDDLSLRALQNLDEDLVRSKAEVDSPASLELLMQWAKLHDTKRFVLWKRTNSGELLNNPNSETTSHMFGYYSDGLPMQTEKSVSFLIGGDMMFARGIHYTFQKDLKQSVAHLGDRVFWGTDLSLINLEGMVSTTPVVPDPRPTFTFWFPPETIDVLKWMHVNVVSIDNNHTNGIKPVGIPTLPHTVQGEGLKITVLGIHTLWGVEDITNQIREVKKDPDQRVIIYPHWGEEYKPKHNAQQEALAHAWIDAGADMVVGSHPHVVQDIEIYQGKPIIYSLGNLLFDQDWSVPTQHGMLVGGKFTDSQVEYFTIPVVSKNFQPEIDFVRVGGIVKLP